MQELDFEIQANPPPFDSAQITHILSSCLSPLSSIFRISRTSQARATSSTMPPPHVEARPFSPYLPHGISTVFHFILCYPSPRLRPPTYGQVSITSNSHSLKLLPSPSHYRRRDLVSERGSPGNKRRWWRRLGRLLLWLLVLRPFWVSRGGVSCELCVRMSIDDTITALRKPKILFGQQNYLTLSFPVQLGTSKWKRRAFHFNEGITSINVTIPKLQENTRQALHKASPRRV